MILLHYFHSVFFSNSFVVRVKLVFMIHVLSLNTSVFFLPYEFARNRTTFLLEPIQKNIDENVFNRNVVVLNSLLASLTIHWAFDQDHRKMVFHKLYGEKSSMFNENNWTQEFQAWKKNMEKGLKIYERNEEWIPNTIANQYVYVYVKCV